MESKKPPVRGGSQSSNCAVQLLQPSFTTDCLMPYGIDGMGVPMTFFRRRLASAQKPLEVLAMLAIAVAVFSYMVWKGWP
jgi:hypothetical protein